MAAKDRAAQADLFASGLPEGFAYREDVLSQAQEADAVRRFEALPFKPFEFGNYVGNRRVVSFGWRYDYAGRALRESAPVPEFLHEMRDTAASFAAIAASSLQQVLVTEYAPGAGIGWHRDKPMFEDVLAFSFCASCRLRFRRKRGDGWDRATVTVAPRSLYLLRGPARWGWYHSIPAHAALRYSVTFRNFKAAGPEARG
ncbi:MAG: alpha-ketoglutarate-dependent dioxygenase AlkB [Alphaproteobacteria bacterium]|nr:alpha-ketoglutarate-dependent dioxygenase AlkB [Alphaproteobacteria bacterium]